LLTSGLEDGSAYITWFRLAKETWYKIGVKKTGRYKLIFTFKNKLTNNTQFGLFQKTTFRWLYFYMFWFVEPNKTGKDLQNSLTDIYPIWQGNKNHPKGNKH